MAWIQLVYRLGVSKEWVIHTAKWKRITKLHALAIKYKYENDRYKTQ